MKKKFVMIAACCMTLTLLSAGCGQSEQSLESASSELSEELSSSENSFAGTDAGSASDAASVSEALSDDEIPTEISTETAAEESETAEEIEEIEVAEDGIIAVDEGVTAENSGEEALEIKDVKDDNSALPFDTDTPIFAFDTDYTLYKSESGEVRSGAIDAIRYLIDRGFKWCIISVDYENSKEGRLQGEILGELNDTDSYLGFYIVNSGSDRYQWCIENGADILVDDNVKTVSLADEFAFPTLLVDAKDEVQETVWMHPMKGDSAYSGFKEYVDRIFPQ